MKELMEEGKEMLISLISEENEEIRKLARSIYEENH